MAAARVVRVAVDVPALADQGRELDYLIGSPEASGHQVAIEVGALVRVPLVGRRVGGWVVATDVEPPPGVTLAPVSKVTGRGPAPDIVALTAWAAWRWAGRRTALLRTASPLTAVGSLPPSPTAGYHTRPPADDPARGGAPAVGTVHLAVDEAAQVRQAWSADDAGQMARQARAAGEAVVRLPPGCDPVPLIVALLGGAPGLVAVPAVEAAAPLALRLRRLGLESTVVPQGWARAAAGGVTVVGARTAVWSPAPDATAIVVLDAHDRGLTEQRAPSWNAWVVAAERARRAGIPCVLVSPCPLLEQLQWGTLIVGSRASERRGWAAVEVLDRRDDDPRSGVVGERLVPLLRGATVSRRVVCVLNRKGRARISACRSCGRTTVCEHCGAAVEVIAETVVGGNGRSLRCPRCQQVRPVICQGCGSGVLRALRSGVTTLRDDVQALARLPVAEVTAGVTHLPGTPILVGTEAVLHRLAAPVAEGRVSVGAVAFIAFDAEMLAPRYSAGEDALALLARAARLVGGRGLGTPPTPGTPPVPGTTGPGRVLVQTRVPEHPVVLAAQRGDPGRLAEAELVVRTELGLPPVCALAELSGDGATVARVAADLAARAGIEVLGPTDGRWLVRASDHARLCDALAAVGRPVGASNAMLRIDVDPTRV